jgi:uncharacterized protein YegP (UPF0339 family)
MMAAKFEIKKSAGEQVMFNLKAANGEVILTSETYCQKRSAEQGIASVKANASDDSLLMPQTPSGVRRLDFADSDGPISGMRHRKLEITAR